MLSTLSYISRKSPTFAPDRIPQMAAQSRDRNIMAGVTGVLVFDGHSFFQTLEGELGSISEMFHRILQDWRHQDVVPFGVSQIEARRFPDWQLQLIMPEHWSNSAMPALSRADLCSPDQIHSLHQQILQNAELKAA